MRLMIPRANGSRPALRMWSDPLLNDFFGDFERMFDSFFEPTAQMTQAYSPACDVSETEDHYVLNFDLPGVRKEDLQIEVKENSLLVSGERRRETKLEEDGVLRHERGFGKFQRVFKLPVTVDTEHIEAQYEDGVLSVAIPKAPEAKSRTIQIQSGKGSLFSRLLGSTKRDEGTETKDARVS